MATTNHYDLDSDTLLGGNSASDLIIPSQKAVKTYVDSNAFTVDQTFNSLSTNAQSGVAIEGELGNYLKSQNNKIKYEYLNSGIVTKISYNSTDDFYTGLEIGDGDTAMGCTLYSLNEVEQLHCAVSVVADEDYVGLDIFTQDYNEQTESEVLLSTVNNTLTVNGSQVATTSDIPTVNNATLTITQGGTTKGTFTANASSDVTIALDAGGGGGSSTLSGLTDVTLTSPSNGQVLGYDGSDWVNKGLKTINSQTIVGSGNIAVQSPLTAGNNITFEEGGQNWSPAYAITGFSGLDWWAVCYGEGKFLAVNIYGYISTSEDDGATWTTPVQDSNLGDYNWWTYVTYGNGTFVSIGYEGYVSVSTDGGDTWSAPEQLLGNHYWNGIAFDGTYFVVVGEQGLVSRSTDGLNWSTPTYINNLGNNGWDSLAYGNGAFVALSPTGKVSISTDSGNSWSGAADISALGNNSWYDLIYDGAKFVAIGSHGYISSSELGISWTQAEYISNLGDRGWTTITSNGSKLIALADSGYYSEVTTSTIISTTGLADTDLSNLTDDGLIAIAHNASPSSTTKSLTLGANGAEYTAEADGWFSLRGNTTSNSGTGINITSNSCSMVSSYYGTGNVVGVIYPVYKGQKVNIYYTNVNSTIFRFIYANGSESEYS